MPIKTINENIIQSAFFSCALIVFCAVSLFTCVFSRETVSFQENRTFTTLPEIHSLKKDLSKFIVAFEPYYQDRVPMRLTMVSARNFLIYQLFGSSGNSLVAIGKNNWLFYKSYGVTPAQLNLPQFQEKELQAWAQDITARKQFLEAHGVRYLLVIAPEKGSMYPELLPYGWARRTGITRMQQLQDYLKKHSDVEFIDAQALLAKEKAKGQKIYHSNDTHWNQRSAFLVSQAILRNLHSHFPSVTEVKADLLLKGHDDFTGDLAKMLGLPQLLPDYSPSIVVNQAQRAKRSLNEENLAIMGSQQPAFSTQVDDINLPRALVLRDSFCTYLTAPLSEHFGFCEYQWTNEFKPQAILQEKPDVVLNEIAERHLYEEFYEHVPFFVRQDRTGKTTTPICILGKPLELLAVSAQTTVTGESLKLTWRTKSPLKLDFIVGVKCLNNDEKVVGGADYRPDVIQRDLSGDTIWTDNIDIADRELKNATKLQFSVYKPGEKTLICRTGVNESPTRCVFFIRDLESKEVNLSQRMAPITPPI